MRKPTASSLERAMRCPGSFALPVVRTTNPYAERGTALHSYLEAIAGGADPEAALEHVPDAWRPVCAALDLERLPKGLAAEVALALDVGTGRARELGRGLARDYSALGAMEYAGTADVIGVSSDAVFVGDYKSGWGDVAGASVNPQLKFLALAAARAYGRDRAVVEVVRLRENGSVYRDRAEFDELDLDTFAAELKALHGRVEAAQRQAAARGAPDVSAGAWCRYCDAWAACPAQRELAIRLGSGAEFEVLQGEGQQLTPAAAGAAWDRLRVAKVLLTKVEDACRVALHEYGELPLPSGKVLREVLEPGNEQLDGRVVYQVVRELHGQAVADVAVEIAATKAGLTRAMRAAAAAGTVPPRGISKAERAVLDVVRDRGGAERPMRRKLVELEPGAPELGGGKDVAA